MPLVPSTDGYRQVGVSNNICTSTQHLSQPTNPIKQFTHMDRMAVSEIAFIHLKSQDLSPSTKETLLEAQKAQTEYSKHQVRFLHQIEDPSFYYLLGGWESVEKHMHEWIPSETNQKLLERLGQDLDVSWMFHLDLDVSFAKFQSI
jgi:hypothetical protein